MSWRTVLRALLLLAAIAWLGFALLAVLRAPTNLAWRLSVLATELGHVLTPVGLLFVPAWRAGRVARAAAVIGWVGSALLLTPLVRAIPVLREVAAADAGSAFRYRLVPGGLPQATPTRIVYARRDSLELPLDFYAPRRQDDVRVPVVVVIHGGSWAAGDPTQLSALSALLAERGYAVAAIGYRLAPRAHHPAQVEDVRESIAWLRAHADSLGLDPQRIVLLGRSAGAHLALLTAYTSSDPGIRGVISFYAPTDLMWGWDHPGSPLVVDSRGVLARFIGDTPDNARATFVDASPIAHVAGAPPTLLFHGARDELVSVVNQRRLAAALAAAGRDVRAVEMSWATHGCDYSLRGPCGNITTRATLQFLQSIL